MSRSPTSMPLVQCTPERKGFCLHQERSWRRLFRERRLSREGECARQHGHVVMPRQLPDLLDVAGHPLVAMIYPEAVVSVGALSSRLPGRRTSRDRRCLRGSRRARSTARPGSPRPRRSRHGGALLAPGPALAGGSVAAKRMGPFRSGRRAADEATRDPREAARPAGGAGRTCSKTQARCRAKSVRRQLTSRADIPCKRRRYQSSLVELHR